jgi:hypothetical protein
MIFLLDRGPDEGTTGPWSTEAEGCSMWTRKRMTFLAFMIGAMAFCGGLVLGRYAGGIVHWISPVGPKAKLLVRTHQPSVLSGEAEKSVEPFQEEYKRYQRTQVNLLKSRRVINAALLKPGIAGLPAIRERNDPISWLRENLEVSFPDGSEVLEISLAAGAGMSREDQARLINAIQSAYMDEVVNGELRQRKERQESLRRLRQTYLDLIKNRRETIQALARSARPDDKSVLLMQWQAALERAHDARSQELKLKLARIEVETLLARRQKAEGPGVEQARQEIPQLEDRLAALQAQQRAVEEEVTGFWKQPQPGPLSEDPVAMTDLQDELKGYQEQADRLSREQERLNIELQAPPRTIKFEDAAP